MIGRDVSELFMTLGWQLTHETNKISEFRSARNNETEYVNRERRTTLMVVIHPDVDLIAEHLRALDRQSRQKLRGRLHDGRRLRRLAVGRLASSSGARR